MKELPEIKNNFGDLYDRLLTNQETNLFVAGIELGVFRELSDWRNPGEVAKRLNLNPKNTGVFLNTLASLDLVEKKNGRFRNSPAADEFLSVENDVYLGDYFLSCRRWYSMSSTDICELVRNGSGDGNMPEIESEEMWAEQAQLSINYQRAGMAQIATHLVSSLPEYLSFKRMLDLGCGPGLVGTSIVMNHPSMSAVLFDRPAVARVARQVVDEYGVSERVEVVAGDYISGPIDGAYDLVWASMTLNFAGDSLNEVIRKIYESLNPGGVFLSFSDGKTNEGTKPKEMVLGTLMPSLYGDDMGMNKGVIAGAALEEGFSSVQNRSMMTPIGEVLVDIARKSV